MSEWFQDMPQSTLPAVKSFFELELLYSYVYILSPSPRIPHIHEYAQRLIFEHCIAYATNLLAILDKPSNTVKPPVTFYDAMRAYMTGRQFVDVLSRNMEMISIWQCCNQDHQYLQRHWLLKLNLKIPWHHLRRSAHHHSHHHYFLKDRCCH